MSERASNQSGDLRLLPTWSSSRRLEPLSTFVLSALHNPVQYPLAVFRSNGYRLIVQRFDDLPRFVVLLADIEGHTTPQVAVGEDILKVGDGLEVARHLTFFGAAEALEGLPVHAVVPEGQQLLGLGQAVAESTGPKGDADLSARELLLPHLLRLPFHYAPPLFATIGVNVPDTTRFY